MKKTLDAEIAKLNGGKPIGHWTLHDLRRSVVTGLNELGIAPHYIEAVVNHISGARGGIAGVYNLAKYAEPKRQAFIRWGEHIEQIVNGKPAAESSSAKIIPLVATA